MLEQIEFYVDLNRGGRDSLETWRKYAKAIGTNLMGELAHKHKQVLVEVETVIETGGIMKCKVKFKEVE